jgi:hypothetical protein
MAEGYSVADLLSFLEHAADRGLLPIATSRALAVAARNVLGMLDDTEARDVRKLDLTDVAKRFSTKRAREFSPDTLKEYDRRVRRAVSMFTSWRDDPANFKAKTRATSVSRKDRLRKAPAPGHPEAEAPSIEPAIGSNGGSGYGTAVPLRPGHVVTISNIPEDLTTAEAERLAQFVRMLVIKG